MGVAFVKMLSKRLNLLGYSMYSWYVRYIVSYIGPIAGAPVGADCGGAISPC
jgi:hypothetical protein